MTSAYNINMLWWNLQMHISIWRMLVHLFVQPASQPAYSQELPGVHGHPWPELLSAGSVCWVGSGKHLSTHLFTHQLQQNLSIAVCSSVGPDAFLNQCLNTQLQNAPHFKHPGSKILVYSQNLQKHPLIFLFSDTQVSHLTRTLALLIKIWYPG